MPVSVKNFPTGEKQTNKKTTKIKPVTKSLAFPLPNGKKKNKRQRCCNLKFSKKNILHNKLLWTLCVLAEGNIRFSLK